jgi:hypothetical protein
MQYINNHTVRYFIFVLIFHQILTMLHLSYITSNLKPLAIFATVNICKCFKRLGIGIQELEQEAFTFKISMVSSRRKLVKCK